MTMPVVNISAVVGDKPIHKSMTAWGVVIFVAAEAGMVEACAAEMLTTVMCGTLATVLKYAGGILTVFGLRRAATAPNVG